MIFACIVVKQATPQRVITNGDLVFDTCLDIPALEYPTADSPGQLVSGTRPHVRRGIVVFIVQKFGQPTAALYLAISTYCGLRSAVATG